MRTIPTRCSWRASLLLANSLARNTTASRADRREVSARTTSWRYWVENQYAISRASFSLPSSSRAEACVAPKSAGDRSPEWNSELRTAKPSQRPPCMAWLTIFIQEREIGFRRHLPSSTEAHASVVPNRRATPSELTVAPGLGPAKLAKENDSTLMSKPVVTATVGRGSPASFPQATARRRATSPSPVISQGRPRTVPPERTGEGEADSGRTNASIMTDSF